MNMRLKFIALLWKKNEQEIKKKSISIRNASVKYALTAT